MRLVMMGTGAFAEPTFEALFGTSHTVVGLITQPDRVVGKERGSTRQAERGMKDIARERNIPIHQPESINTPEGIATLKQLQPDLLVVAAYGQILSKDVLAVPTKGGINIHASLLPKYRGAAPVAWAIYHGETKTGVTIIRMSPSLDAGDILAQESLDIGPMETAGELETRLSPLGAKLSVEVIDRLSAGPIDGHKQDKSQVTKAPKLTKEHGLIDWTRDGFAVVNQIRAMQPWPTAYTFLHRAGKAPVRVLIFKAVAQAADDFCQAHEYCPDHDFLHKPFQLPPPGHITLCADKFSGLNVGAGDKTVIGVNELQLEGKRRVTAQEFVRGHQLKPGDHFGSEEAS